MPLLNDANAVLLGTNPVDAVYLGDATVWSSVPPPLYLGRFSKRHSTSTSAVATVAEVLTSKPFGSEPNSLFFNEFGDQDLDGQTGLWNIVAAGLNVELTRLDNQEVWTGQISSTPDKTPAGRRLKFSTVTPTWTGVNVQLRVSL